MKTHIITLRMAIDAIDCTEAVQAAEALGAHLTGFDPVQSVEVLDCENKLDEALERAVIQCADSLYTGDTDDIEIPEDQPLVSESEDGFWVEARVWVARGEFEAWQQERDDFDEGTTEDFYDLKRGLEEEL